MQTLTAREAAPPADLVVWDEAHHCAAETYRAIRAQYPGAWHLGLTATPERSDGAPLGDAFGALVAPVTVAQLVAAGHLAPIEVVAPAKRLTGALGADPVEALRAHGRGAPAVVFAATVAESRELVARWGAGAAHLDGSTPRAERDAILARFERGELGVVSNVFVLTEGWDSARAEVCVLARGCGSLATYLQAIGRVRRTGGRASKRCTLLDLAGAVHEHGMPDADRTWSLVEGQSTRASDRAWLAQCPACAFVCEGAKLKARPDGRRACPCCGALMNGRDPLVVKAQRLERVEAAHQDDSATRRRYLDQMAAVAKRAGYKPGWAAVRYQARYGVWPEGSAR